MGSEDFLIILFIKADGVDLLQPDRLLSSIAFQTRSPPVVIEQLQQPYYLPMTIFIFGI